MVERGRIDICLEVYIMSSHLAMPREGHMAEVLRMLAHPRKYHRTELVFDPSDLVVDEIAFEQRDKTSSEFRHVQVVELILNNLPKSRGIGFAMRAKVDTYYAGDTVTR
eukprot:1614590-Ditylum_brightwellii.AAC.1